MLGDQLEVDNVAEQRLQGAVIGGAIDRAQHLVGKILQSRHELDAEQGAQPEEVLGEAMGVRGMLADRQDSVVFEDAGEHVTRFARCAGDHPRGVDTVLVGSVGIEGERAVVIAEIAGIEAAEQAVALDRKALPVGRRAAAVSPDTAERQMMVVIDEDGVGCREGFIAQKPSAGVLQHFRREVVDALAHRSEAEIGAVGNQRGEQRAIGIARVRGHIAAECLKSAGEAAPLVNVLEHVLDAHAGKAGAEGVAQAAQLA